MGGTKVTVAQIDPKKFCEIIEKWAAETATVLTFDAINIFFS